jgi:hypothetical protein
MEGIAWIEHNWFVLLQSVGIIAGLVFTGVTLRLDVKSRRVSNLIELTEGHRDIWSQFYRRPELARVLNPHVDLSSAPVTEEERIFVSFLILHLSSTYHALHHGLTMDPEGLRQDIRRFFSLPIPHAVWEKVHALQDRAFVKFVEACLRGDAVFSRRPTWRFFGRRGGH